MAKVISLPKERRGRRVAHKAIREINDLASMELSENKQFKTAIIATKRAIRVTTNSRELWSNIGTYFFNTQQYAEAEAAFLRALKLDDKYPIGYANLALVYGATHQYDKALENYAIAEELDPKYLTVRWNRSLLRLKMGDYKTGFEEYESRIAHNRDKGRLIYAPPAAPWYKHEPLEGKSVYVIGEQGYGDTIMFSRFLPWLHSQGCKIYICVDPLMTGLLWYYREMVEFVPLGVPIPKTDYAIAMGSLPYFSGVTLDTLPPDPKYILRRIQDHIVDAPIALPTPQGPEPFKVGINWRGNPEMDRYQERSIPFIEMLRVAENPYVWPHSFQIGPGVADIANAGASQLVCDLSPALVNCGLVGCASAIMRMDLIITSCTMLAHLAGSLGVPCWVVLCYDAYWPWLSERQDSPWYPSVRLFRQPAPGDWTSVMNDVLKELDQVITLKKERKYG